MNDVLVSLVMVADLYFLYSTIRFVLCNLEREEIILYCFSKPMNENRMKSFLILDKAPSPFRIAFTLWRSFSLYDWLEEEEVKILRDKQ